MTALEYDSPTAAAVHDIADRRPTPNASAEIRAAFERSEPWAMRDALQRAHKMQRACQSRGLLDALGACLITAPTNPSRPLLTAGRRYLPAGDPVGFTEDGPELYAAGSCVRPKPPRHTMAPPPIFLVGPSPDILQAVNCAPRSFPNYGNMR